MSGGSAGDTIAIVGMACRYPDADDLPALWELVLTQRRAFRRIPPERLDLADYLDSDPSTQDATYSAHAALIEGWEFDRGAFNIPGPVYRAGDPAHWLALETAGRALADAGFRDGDGLDRDRVLVVVGNTLTGEVTRASTLRLRWPYVRQVLTAALSEAGLTAEQRRDVVGRAAEHYLRPFPPVNEETLAGGLSNTIAGRICNYFGFHGGGYTVDGACASSLLAVITACSALCDGSADLALAGGVDISLDPFELVGFAKTGALAGHEMRVYDENPTGFLPGEGCGVVALMRTREARAAGLRVYAEIAGWGVSSDGKGGITRPARHGQLLGLRRAYERAGVNPTQVELFEGHGTGTAIGDLTELTSLNELRRGAATQAVIGSVKGNFGHTKAAAGVAGLIKATLAVANETLPPITGCVRPHPLLRDSSSALRVLDQPEPWGGGPRLAGVSAMGFGGINTHTVLRAPELARRRVVAVSPAPRPPTPRTDVITLRGSDAEVRQVLTRLSELGPCLSEAEVHDLAYHYRRPAQGGTLRVALVASTPEQLAERGERAREALDRMRDQRLVADGGAYLGRGVAGRVTLLLPGQGAPIYPDAGALGASPLTHALGSGEHRTESGPERQGPVDTATAQPVIYRTSLAALRWLERLGVRPIAAVGHSLGEITGLVWAGCLAEADGERLVVERGRLMSELGNPDSGMVAIAADTETTTSLADGTALVVAAYNGPRSHVLAGATSEVRLAAGRAAAAGIHAAILPVSRAFHSPAVADCAAAFKAYLETVPFGKPTRRLISTVTGRCLTEYDSPGQLLCEQIRSPVLFWDAIREVHRETDLFCEAGPGRTLCGLLAQCSDTPAVSVDAGNENDAALAETAAALFAAGAVDDLAPLFVGRAARGIDIWRERVFITNPCSMAPQGEPSTAAPVPAEPIASGETSVREPSPPPQPTEPQPRAPQLATSPQRRVSRLAASGRPTSQPAAVDGSEPKSVQAILVARLAEAIELEPAAIKLEQRMLSDLHLTSLRVAQIVGAAADVAGRQRPMAPLTMADASVAEIVAAIEALPHVEDGDAGQLGRGEAAVVPGIAPWVYCFAEERRPYSAPPAKPPHQPQLVRLADPRDVDTLLRVARSAVETGQLAVVTHDTSLSGFLRGLWLEYPDIGITLLRAPASEAGVGHAARYAAVEPGRFREIIIDSQGRAFEPTLAVRPLPATEGSSPLAAQDVILVTGGGKGIGYECAAALARSCGASLALIGRADPESDGVLADNLARLADAGIRAVYQPADVTDETALAQAVRRLTDELGPITAIIHASGINEPRGFADLTAEEVRAHLAPKLVGMRNLMSAVPVERLKTLVTFGSVIGRYGLAGECHYALANGVLRALAEWLVERLPDCRILHVDWSVWTGTGMGERLGVLDTLLRLDVTPIAVNEGTQLLLQLLSTPDLPTTVTVQGRVGALQQDSDAGGTPSGRFCEAVRVHYPGVELVADAQLSLRADPYLDEHRIDGLAVLPAVVGLEAMAQAASTVAGRPLRAAADIELPAPVVVPDDAPRTIRVCALRRDNGIETVLRSEESGFATDHFRAFFPFEAGQPYEIPDVVEGGGCLDADELYGPVYFHTGRFRRVRRLTAPSAVTCRADIDAGGQAPWFAASQDRPLLGDPGVNDATIHALQACVPHRRLLPVSCERFAVLAGYGDALRLFAAERHADKDGYVWDVAAVNEAGEVAIAWIGLRLKDVGALPRTSPWPRALLAIYLERVANALGLAGSLRITIGRRRGGRKGKPVISGPGRMARSHLNGLTLMAAGPDLVSCDWESISAGRDCVELLGPQGKTLAGEVGSRLAERPEITACRVWTAQECLSKAGLPPGTPLTVAGVYEGGWLLLRAGLRGGQRTDTALIASTVVEPADVGAPTAVAIMTGDPRGR